MRVLFPQTGRPRAGRLRMREIDDDVGRRLGRIVRRGSGSVVTTSPPAGIRQYPLAQNCESRAL